MLVWIEVCLPLEFNLSSFYKNIGFEITSPTIQTIQYIFSGSVLSIINDMVSYNHLMNINDPIKKQTTMTKAINKYMQEICDMCYSSPCAMLCDKIMKV